MHIPGHQPKTFDTPIQIILAAGFGILLGVLSAVLSPLNVLIGLAGLLVVLLGFKKPEFSILAIIAILCTIYPEDHMPRITIGFGRLYISEFIGVGLFILALIRLLTEEKFKFRSSPMNAPMIMFFIWSTVVSIILMMRGEIERATLISEVRIITYYLLFFLVVNLLRDRASIVNLVHGFILLATLVSVAMVAQYLLGTKVAFLPGRVETLVTEGQVYSNVTRIVDTVGEGSIIAAFTVQTILLMTRSWSFKPTRLFQLAEWILLAIAVILTFSRTIWIVILFGIGLTALIIGMREKIKMIKWVLAFFYLSPLLIVFFLLRPGSSFGNLLIVSLERFASLADSSAYSTSETDLSTFRWRDFEYTYGIPTIEEHPITGIGLGAQYRPFVAGINEPTDLSGFDGRNYTHNGHMWIAMKTGLVGYGLFLWFSLLYIFRSLKYWRKIPDGFLQRVILGFTVCYIAVLIGSITHPMIMTLYWTPILGMMLGTNEAIIQFYTHPDQA